MALTIAEAWPDASVDTVTGDAILAVTPPGPANVTGVLGTGLLALSNTNAIRGALKAVPTAVLCVFPETREMDAGIAAVLLNVKTAVAASPVIEAVIW